METKRFTKNDSGFICENCKNEVLPLGFTSRNHCPFCLASKHLDIFPGDRAAKCGGVMLPVKTEPDPKKGFIIYHKCQKCGHTARNKAVADAKIQPDNMDLLIKLTASELM